MNNAPRMYLVSEMFGPTIQGEGHAAGFITLFLRLFGCDWDCTWCDTQFAVSPKYPGAEFQGYTAEEILLRLNKLNTHSAKWLTITGGNPAAQAHIDLVETLGESYRIIMECQGRFRPGWELWVAHPNLELLVLSPKPPSSGMEERNNIEQLSEVISFRKWNRQKVSLKYVVHDEADLDWIKQFHGELRRKIIGQITLECLQPVTLAGETPEQIIQRYHWLVEQVLQDRYWGNWRILPQLHNLLWPHKRGK